MREKVGDPGLSTADLLKRVLKKALGKPMQKPAPKKSAFTSHSEVKAVRREHIPQGTRRELKTRAQNQCTYISAFNGRRCTQKHGLQIEHIIPWAKGGSSQPQNLTLLCPNHNHLRAIEEFGEERIARHLIPAAEAETASR